MTYLYLALAIAAGQALNTGFWSLLTYSIRRYYWLKDAPLREAQRKDAEMFEKMLLNQNNRAIADLPDEDGEETFH